METAGFVKCDICNQLLGNRNSLRRHLCKFHPYRPKALPDPRMICGMCAAVLLNNHEFESHIKDVHEVVVEHESSTFKSMEEFKTWLRTTEELTSAKFVKITVNKKSQTKTVAYYRCNRSGQTRSRVSPEDRKRQPKKQGSCKAVNHCTARITARTFSDGTVQADFCKTHFGHKTDLKHLSIPSPKQRKPASQIAAKVPLGDIFDRVQCGFGGNKELEHQFFIRTVFENAGIDLNVVSDEVNSQIQMSEEDDCQNLINDDEPQSPETRVLSHNLRPSESVFPPKLSDDIKKRVEERFALVMNQIQNDEEMCTFGKIIKTAIPILNAARNRQSQNSSFKSQEKVNVKQKIDPQRKFTNNRKLKRGSRMNKPTTSAQAGSCN